MCNFVAIKNTKIKSLCKPLEIEFKKNFFLCKLLRAVTLFFKSAKLRRGFVNIINHSECRKTGVRDKRGLDKITLRCMNRWPRSGSGRMPCCSLCGT